MHICIYIYIYVSNYIKICRWIYVYKMYMCIYIYIYMGAHTCGMCKRLRPYLFMNAHVCLDKSVAERQRERERERERETQRNNYSEKSRGAFPSRNQRNTSCFSNKKLLIIYIHMFLYTYMRMSVYDMVSYYACTRNGTFVQGIYIHIYIYI